MLSLVFSSRGRLQRQPFIMSFVAITLLVLIANFGLRSLSGMSDPDLLRSLGAFALQLIPFLALYMLYCICTKRLRDMGRGAGLFWAMIAAEFIAIIVVMLIFGGAEYFTAFSQYSKNDTIDPAIRDNLIAQYQSGLTEHMPVIRTLLLIIPLGFAAWLALTSSITASDKPVHTIS